MRIKVLGTGFDSLTMEQAVEKALALSEEQRAAYVVTPNPEIVMLCRDDQAMSKAVGAADMVIPDGIGVIYGAKILGTPLREKLPGIDFTLGLMEKMQERGGSVYLFGARPGVADAAEERLKQRFPDLRFVGTSDGYFDDDTSIIAKINAAKPNLLLVCLGAPKQEKWMCERGPMLDVGLMIGAGGSMDVFAGTVERAPERWQKAGLEWLYRLIKEPKRIGRMMKLPEFLILVILERIRGKNDAR